MSSQSTESRWFWIPGLFGALLFLSSLLWWLPAAIVRAGKPYGLGHVVVGDLRLAWYSLLRCAVAYVVTAIALDYLPPIRWRHAFVIAGAALVIEILAEIVTSAIFGAHANFWAPLIATAIAYSVTAAIIITVIQKMRTPLMRLSSNNRFRAIAGRVFGEPMRESMIRAKCLRAALAKPRVAQPHR